MEFIDIIKEEYVYFSPQARIWIVDQLFLFSTQIQNVPHNRNIREAFEVEKNSSNLII